MSRSPKWRYDQSCHWLGSIYRSILPDWRQVLLAYIRSTPWCHVRFPQASRCLLLSSRTGSLQHWASESSARTINVHEDIYGSNQVGVCHYGERCLAGVVSTELGI